MRSNVLALRRSIRILINRKYATRENRCDAHMNELPVPCGPWDAWYKAKQSYYNKVLAFGVVWNKEKYGIQKAMEIHSYLEQADWCAFSFGMMLYTGSLYLNWGPPPQPGPPSDIVEECDDSN